MKRLKTVPMAITAVALAAGTVAAFSTLPDAAGPGLQKASDASGKTVPVRAVPADVPPAAPAADPVEAPAVELPDAASHGATVSAAARADDATPDTNHGADVSAAARDNAGQAGAAAHRPSTAGKPADAGKPDGAGKPADPGKPENPGRP
ncbi:MAG: hypothetical protein ACJ769_04080 [Chloroflexota bacterium]